MSRQGDDRGKGRQKGRRRIGRQGRTIGSRGTDIKG